MNEYNFDKINSELKEINLCEIWNNTEGITKIFLHYDPYTNILDIIGICKDTQISIKKCEIDPYTLVALLTGVIQNPFYITANTEKIENIAVEFAEFR